MAMTCGILMSSRYRKRREPRLSKSKWCLGRKSKIKPKSNCRQKIRALREATRQVRQPMTPRRRWRKMMESHSTSFLIRILARRCPGRES